MRFSSRAWRPSARLRASPELRRALDPAGGLLRLELGGAVVPVVDLLGQAILHGGLRLGNQAELSGLHLVQALGHDMRNGVALRLLFEIATDPAAFGTSKLWKLACPKGELDLVFPTATGAIMYHRSMLDSLAPVMVAAGVVDKGGRPKYGLHAFRHFFASGASIRRSGAGVSSRPRSCRACSGTAPS